MLKFERLSRESKRCSSLSCQPFWFRHNKPFPGFISKINNYLKKKIEQGNVCETLVTKTRTLCAEICSICQRCGLLCFCWNNTGGILNTWNNLFIINNFTAFCFSPFTQWIVKIVDTNIFNCFRNWIFISINVLLSA